MPIAFLPFSVDRRFHGTAAPGTREAKATRGLCATQKVIAACCRSAAGEATATERVRSIGVTILIGTSLQRGATCVAQTQPLQRIVLPSGKPLKRLEKNTQSEHLAKARC